MVCVIKGVRLFSFLNIEIKMGWGKCHRNISAELWWHTPLIPALRRQRQVGLYEFKASLVYRISSRIARATQRTLSQKKKKKRKEKEKKERYQ